MKNTKRSLLLSALALVICVTMLIGSTFAWFTDSASTAVNTIQSGKLDVVLEKFDEAKGEWVTAEGETLKWITTDAVDNVLWEPGCTYKLPLLRVRNAGNLALKYEVEITGLKGDAKLLEVIEFTGLPTDATLTAGAANEFQIEGHMAEEAGNEYQNLKIDNIAIAVYATQLAYESDSYGPDYDEEAVIGTYIELGEGEDLLAALASAEAGKPVTIKLMGNVEWPTEGHHGENDITPASAIVINGNGYTITATGAGVTPIGDTEAPMTLKNVKIVDKSVSYKENAWEFTYLEIGGTKLTCENVTFADEIQFGTNATFTNCTFESNEESVYAVWVEDGNATFINCAFTGYRGIKVHEDYGSEVKTVVVDNCTFKNITKKPGMAIGTLNADTTVAIKDSKFVGCQAGDQGLYIYETDTDVTTFNFTESGNELFGLVTDNTALKTALSSAQAGDTVYVADGEYTLPKLNKGVTIIGSENTVVTNTLSGTLNDVTIKNIKIKAGDAQRWAYGKGKVVFENCTFEATSVYAIHYDSLSGANITYKDCTIIGWAALGSGAEHITFDGCKIYGNGAYGLIRVYSPATIKNCTFDVSAVNTTDVYQDGIHAVDCEIKVSNNINVNGAIEDLYNVSGTGKIVAE